MSSSSSSSSSGWMSSIKGALSTAAEATQKAAKSAAEATKKTYEDLKAPPSSIQCSGCPLQVEVPANAFDWQCTNGHSNSRNLEKCAECSGARPSRLNDPAVTCSSCSTVTVVPSSNASKSLRSAVDTTKRAVSQAVDATKQQIQYLQSTPDTFHCAHCNSLLAVPTGPWACQTCTTENAEDLKLCRQCGQKKTDQKAICGVCRQSTIIPSSNFIDGIKSTTREISESSRKVFYDVSGKPYVTCNRCQTNIALPKQVGSTTDATSAVAAGSSGNSSPTNAGATSTDASQAPTEASATEASAPGSTLQVTHANTDTIICPNCKNQLSNN
jgi:hypothetical protein